MKPIATLFIVLISLLALLLTACGAGNEAEPPAANEGEPTAGDPPAATEEPTPQPDADDSAETLLEDLRAAGLEVEAAGPVEDPFFNVETQLLLAGDAMIQVYLFADQAAADEAIGSINPGGTIIGASTVDWIEPPHFYSQGRLLALYAGSDEQALAALESALGAPFIVGQTMGLPIGAGDEAMDYAGFVDALEAAGAEVEPVETLDPGFFDTTAQIIEVNGAQLQVYEFADPAAAQAAAATVSEDGTEIGSAVIRWMDAPHFYQQGRIIVLYLGNDAQMLSLLEEILGPQFAGM